MKQVRYDVITTPGRYGPNVAVAPEPRKDTAPKREALTANRESAAYKAARERYREEQQERGRNDPRFQQALAATRRRIGQ